jgi:CrcB protein
MDRFLPYLMVGAGALLGANARYGLSNLAADRWGADFPYGTFIINVSGSFVIGIALTIIGTRVGISPMWRLLIVVGFLGGYTTFSSYAWEALTLGTAGAWTRFTVYTLGSNLLGLFAVWLGSRLTQLFV